MGQHKLGPIHIYLLIPEPFELRQKYRIFLAYNLAQLNQSFVWLYDNSRKEAE